jgi:hypothetical protein
MPDARFAENRSPIRMAEQVKTLRNQLSRNDWFS